LLLSQASTDVRISAESRMAVTPLRFSAAVSGVKLVR
jgi:hypothetical protein